MNGRFLAALQTGVQRFALEITHRVLPRADAVILIPRDTSVPESLSRHADVVEGRLRGHAWEQVELPELARKAGADVCLHLANALPASGGPHAVVLHDTTVLDHPEWFSARYALWHRRVLLPAARRAAAVGTLSASTAGALSRVLRRAPEEITVIPQGAAPIDTPATPSAVDGVRRRFGIEGPYLLAVGAGDPRKNIAFLEGVMAAWREVDEPTPVLVVAGGAAARVFATPEGEGRGARTVRTGRVDDEALRALYTGAAAFCFPSLAEGFGRPPLEALACGTPVVVAPYAPVREVLGDAAEVVPLRVDAWLAALERLWAHGPASGFAERARAVVRRHRWEDGAKATMGLCARALSAGQRSRAKAGSGGSSAGREASERPRGEPSDAASLSSAAEHGRLSDASEGSRIATGAEPS